MDILSYILASGSSGGGGSDPFDIFNITSNTIPPTYWAKLSDGSWYTNVVLPGMTANGFAVVGTSVANRTDVANWNKYGIHVDHFEKDQLYIRTENETAPSDTLKCVILWAPTNPFDPSTAFGVSTNTPGSNESETYTTVTLSSASWSNKQQTASVTGVTANSIIRVSPTPTSFDSYCDCGIKCSEQGSGTLTFTCKTVPTTDLVINISVR